MKRKSLLFLLLMAMFAPLAMNGQSVSTLTVYGDNTTTNEYVPIYGYYADEQSKCEFIIPAAKLSAMNGGIVSDMKFYLSSSSNNANISATFNVFVKEVSTTTLTGFTGTTNATSVYTNTISIPKNQSNIVLDIPFSSNYNYGGGNLLIGVYQTVNSSYNHTYWTGVDQSGNTAWQGYGSGSGSGRKFLPKTTFTYTPASNCPTPTITGVTPTAHGGTIAVSNTSASNFNVRYRVAGSTTTYDFESGMPTGWTTIDADGDGHNWTSGTSPSIAAHNSSGSVYSESYDNDNKRALTPDNFLVSPQIVLGGSISFWACAQDANYPAEKFGVAVSTTGNASDSDFTTIQSWTMTAKGAGAKSGQTRSGNRASGTWHEYTVDLSSYSGQGYVAIRHFDCTDQFYLVVDDITIEGPWQNANDLILTGLDPDTQYEVQVQAVCGGSDGESGWSNIYTFTTLESTCDVPSNLSANNISNTGATLSWTKGGTETNWVLEYGTASDFTGATQVTSGFSTSGTTVSKPLSLSAGTTYYARVKANCGQGDESEWSDTYTFTTHSVPSVTTGSATNVIQTSFTMGGTLNNAGGVAATRGIWYSTNNPNNNPTTSSGTMVAAGTASTETGAYTVDLTNLSAGTTYYCCAYATNTYGTVFGNVITVTTSNPGAPVVTTNSTCTADDTSITCGGNVMSDGGNAITERGICYMQGTSGDPTTSNTCVTATGTTGEFTVTLNNLTSGTSYRCRAYATNSNGTSYGDTYTFSTGAMPTVVTSQATSVSSINITIGGILTRSGGASTTYGICYSHTAATPTISDSKVEAGTTVEDDTYFDVTLLSLTPGNIYYCRAYATNAFGTTYGDVVVVFTKATAGTPITETATVYVETNTLEEGKYLILHGNSAGSQYAMNNNYGSSINRTSVTVQNGTITPVGGEPTTANYVETLTTTCVWGVGVTNSGTLVIYNDYNSNQYYITAQYYEGDLILSTDGGITWTYSNNRLKYTSGDYYIYYNNAYQFSSSSTPLYLFKGTDVITDSYYSVEVSATTGGTVSQTNNNGHYNLGDICSVTATPNSGYTFAYWSENGREISYKPTYTFQVDDNRNLVAHFNEITLCPKPTHFDVDNIGGHDAELSWKNTGAETYEVRYGEYTIEPLWLQYDNGTVVDEIGSSTSGTWTWGVMYPAEKLAGNNSLTKISVYESSNNTGDITVNIYSGGTSSPETLLHTQTFTTQANDAFHEVTLSSAVTIDPTKNLWITLTETGTYIMPCYTISDGETNSDWVLDGSTWGHISDLAPSLAGAGWMIRGYVEYDSSIAPTTIVPPYVVSVSPNSITWTTKEPTTDNPYELAGLASGTRYVTQVRGNCGGGDGDSPWSDMIVFTTLPTYNVTLNTNGGTINSGNIDEYTYTVGATLPTDITKTGYAFAGWYDNSSLTGTAVTTISTTETGDKEFWAYYVAAGDITLTAYPTEGGTLAGADTYAIGSEVTVSATATSPYQFINWTENGTVVSTDADYTFTVTADRTLVANFGFIKTIINRGDGGYQLIASPIGGVAPANVTNMTANDFDLYRYNANATLQWENYKQEGEHYHFNLEPGRGYLYANSETVDLVFMGQEYSGNTLQVSLNAQSASGFKNWNLVGNPFAEIAHIQTAQGQTLNYYTVGVKGGQTNQYIPATNTSIQPMEGVFVIASVNGETITFARGESETKSSQLALNINSSRNLVDRAIVRFDECRQLPKFQLNEDYTKVYIPMDGEDYAVVHGEEMGELPVNFKAEENGHYSLSLSSENVEFAYLHLIDNMTGNEVDLLQTPNYSFEAKTTDYASRFKLVYATGDNSNSDNFAFFSNGSFVINNDGNAELQVVDIMGRILSSETINGCANVSVNAAPGVYMLRLINGTDVKVQKVVVK